MDDIIVEDIDDLMKHADVTLRHGMNVTEKDIFDLEQNIQALKLRQPKHPKIREAQQFLHTLRHRVTRHPKSPPETNVQKLQKSLAVLAECETQADDTLTELKRQREAIQRSQENVTQIRAHELPRAHRFIHSMLAWWK